MKVVMSTCPVLTLPIFSRPFVLECYAFGEGIRVVFMQDWHPMDFESKKLMEYERIYPIYDKDMFAIMHALAKFRECLVGGHFMVRIDHNSLRYFLE